MCVCVCVCLCVCVCMCTTVLKHVPENSDTPQETGKVSKNVWLKCIVESG